MYNFSSISFGQITEHIVSVDAAAIYVAYQIISLERYESAQTYQVAIWHRRRIIEDRIIT